MSRLVLPIHAVAAAPACTVTDNPRRARRVVRRLCGVAAMSVLGLLVACSTPGSRGTRSAGPDGPPPAGTSPDPMTVPPVEPKVEPIRQGGPNKPYEVLGQSYVPMTTDAPLVERGLASWYGRQFHGHRTASGETYNMHALTAAHKTMPIPSYARVRNPANGREIIVRVNDRGPFAAGRIIDLSWAAAVQLGVQNGVREVEVERITYEDIRAGLARPAAPAPVVAAVSRPPIAAPAPVPGSAASTGAARGLASTPTAAASGAGVPPQASAEPVLDRARARTEAASGYWIQLGAFGRSDGATSFQRKVAQELDWLAPLLAVFFENGVHRLQAGPYPDRDQARDAAERIREALQLVPVLVERR